MNQGSPKQPAAPEKSAIVLFTQRWLITTLGVLVATSVVPAIQYDTVPGLLVASGLLGALNAVSARMKLLLGCLTLGIFTLLFNGLLLTFVSYLVPSFHVDGFWPALFGGIVISLVSVIAMLLTGFGMAGNANANFSFKVTRGEPRSPSNRKSLRDDDDDDNGPVIDV